METRVTRVTDPQGADAAAGGAEACLVMIYGPRLGKKFVLDKDETVIGRDPSCDIVLDDLDNVSRRHCVILCRESDFAAADLGSKNGTWVDGKEISGAVPLHSGVNVKVGGAIFKFLFGDSVEAAYHEAIYQMTIVDGLTQINNKRYFLEFIEREMARCQRYGRALSLMMFDIDHFKKVNDTHGHLAGDHVLKEVAAVIKARIRKEECFARYGGEEFAVVMPEAPAENALLLAEKLRALVEKTKIVFEGKHIPITISGGVAQLDGEMTSPVGFIHAADERLYKAKESGRNRIVGG